MNALTKFICLSLLRNTIITKEEKKIRICVIETILSTLFSADKIEISPKTMNNKYENEWGFSLNTDRNSSIVFFLSTSKKLIRFKTARKRK